MKIANYITLIFILFVLLKEINSQTIFYNNLDINNIKISITNVGNLDGQFPDYGAFWNKLPDNKDLIIYSQGPWVVGKIDGYLHAAVATGNSTLSPGPIINYNAARLEKPEDSLLYRTYKLSESNYLLNPDYIEWPMKWGAPVDEYRNPVLYGNQQVWTVVNGMDSLARWRIYWNEELDTLPLIPVEIQQLAFAYNIHPDNLLDDIIFFEWTFINKGNKYIDSTFFGLWTDIDFVNAFYNFPAVDTSLELGYCWYPVDTTYDGSKVIPPAVGYSLLYGPSVSSPGDEAIFKGRKINNYRNLNLYSFHPIEDDASEDSLFGWGINLDRVWYFATGKDLFGNEIVNPTNDQKTKFPLSGDPVTGQGWLFPHSSTGGMAGFVMFSGPFNMAPGDTQWVMAALIPGLGEDKFSSIQKMRENAEIIRSIPYNQLVSKTSLTKPEPPLPEYFYLSQNYPNPFNPNTKIEYQIPVASHVEIKLYDILGREVAIILNEEKQPGRYRINFHAGGLASGVYIYRIIAGSFTESKKMILLR